MDATNTNNNRNTDHEQPGEPPPNQFDWNWWGHFVVDLGALNQQQGWAAIKAAGEQCKATGKCVSITFQNNWD